MAKYRSHSIVFKRQIAQEFLAGETLHGLEKRHDISRNLIRVWVERYRTVITHPYRPALARQAGAECHSKVARITSKGFAALRREVSIVVRTSASAWAAHTAR